MTQLNLDVMQEKQVQEARRLHADEPLLFTLRMAWIEAERALAVAIKERTLLMLRHPLDKAASAAFTAYQNAKYSREEQMRLFPWRFQRGWVK